MCRQTGGLRVWWRKRHPQKVEATKAPKLEVPPEFGRPKQPPRPLDTLVIDGREYQAIDGTILTPGTPWVLRAKLLLKPGDTEHVEQLIRLHAVVKATFKRDGGDASHGEAVAKRGSCFRDREGRNCASLELIGTGELKHL